MSINLTEPYTNDEKELLDLKAALDLTSIVARTDLKGIITYVNDKFCQISKYSREELMGQNHRILNSGHHPKSLWKQMYAVVATGKPWHYEVYNRAKDGSFYWVDTTIIGFFDDNNRLDHYIAIRTDITARKQLELKLEQQQIELIAAKNHAEQANQSKSNFLAKISHELRTPMHSIISFSTIGSTRVEANELTKLAHYFQRINKSGQRLLDLLNDLLDLSKLESGKMVIDLSKTVDLCELINDCIEEYSSLLRDKELNVATVLSTNLRAVMDRKLLYQVISNLLSNAIKFSSDNKTITISCSIISPTGEATADSCVYFSIEDQGIGIPHSELESIFSPFNESSRTVNHAQGTGLGLAICQEIINQHRGKIWAENNHNGGSLFHFILPLSAIATIN